MVGFGNMLISYLWISGLRKNVGGNTSWIHPISKLDDCSR